MSVRRTRNDTDFWFCLLNPSVRHTIVNEYGNETGETILEYASAVSMSANISPATGMAQSELFGNLENYDKVIVSRDMSCPIDENTVLFIDTQPSYTSVQTFEVIEPQTVLGSSASSLSAVTYQVPKYNYTVRRVAKSLNSISIAVRKVDVS